MELVILAVFVGLVVLFALSRIFVGRDNTTYDRTGVGDGWMHESASRK
jgi:hypothetical protein